jgi:hypothetical protein
MKDERTIKQLEGKKHQQGDWLFREKKTKLDVKRRTKTHSTPTTFNLMMNHKHPNLN